MTGYIKSIVGERGFGFINDPSGTSHFFHRSAVLNNGFDALTEDDEVVFDAVPTSPKGPRAENVQLASAS